MSEERTAEEIIVKYNDGTSKAVEKGLVFFIAETEETAHITAEMLNMSGQDLGTVVMAAIDLGNKLGMFREGGPT